MTKTETLYDLLIAALPDETEAINYAIFRDKIIIQNDVDGTGDYFAKWDYINPVPASLASYVR